MEKQFKIFSRQVWLAANLVLLTLIVISSVMQAESVAGVCTTLIILISYPTNLLVGWLFFAFDGFQTSPGAMFLLAVVCSAISYLQWFILVPQFADFIRRKYVKHDSDFNPNINAYNRKAVAEPDLECDNISDWQTDYYDFQNRTPLERVIVRDSNG